LGHQNLPVARAREHIKAFARLGWVESRQRGSHISLKKPGCRAVLTIPDHGNVKRPLLARMLKDAGITEDEYLNAFGGH
jgi:predicted RNA binding protein YcfA (HicA-like mRNA interferase family)